MVITDLNEKHIWDWLETVPDPEVPALSIIELGIVRDVTIDNSKVTVTITPTYMGCPAMQTFEKDIKTCLKNNGVEEVAVKTVYSPAWTTDWMTDEARKKLKDYGIAPPDKGAHLKRKLFSDHLVEIQCPYCDSKETKLTSEFGSTACKSMHYCNACQQPFEHFKCI